MTAIGAAVNVLGEKYVLDSVQFVTGSNIVHGWLSRPTRTGQRDSIRIPEYALSTNPSLNGFLYAKIHTVNHQVSTIGHVALLRVFVNS
jgi:hypothetical protein